MHRSLLLFALLLSAFTITAAPMNFTMVPQGAAGSKRTVQGVEMSGDIKSGDYEKFRNFVSANLRKYQET
jgi:hypothetical protein